MESNIENLRIYKLAEKLEIFIYKVTEKFPKIERFRSIDRLRRSSASVTDNISEVYYRYHYNDKIHRLCIARGEVGETMTGIIKAYKKWFTTKRIAEFVSENIQN